MPAELITTPTLIASLKFSGYITVSSFSYRKNELIRRMYY